MRCTYIRLHLTSKLVLSFLEKLSVPRRCDLQSHAEAFPISFDTPGISMPLSHRVEVLAIF